MAVSDKSDSAVESREVFNPSSVPEPRMPMHADYSQFVWQKLNDLDKRFIDFSEKYGRVEEKLTAIDKRLEKSEGKISDLRDDVKSAKNWISAVIVIVGALFGIYKLIEGHITWH